MLTSLLLSALLASSAPAGSALGAQATSPADFVLGTWEGESKCMVPSPCTSEHVIYEISQDEKDAKQLKMDGYKVVQGEKLFMGTLLCSYQASKKTLACSFRPDKKDDWQFQVDGQTMTGVLYVGDDKKLHRRISVKRAAKTSSRTPAAERPFPPESSALQSLENVQPAFLSSHPCERTGSCGYVCTMALQGSGLRG
jgi:hypothetical protein